MSPPARPVKVGTIPYNQCRWAPRDNRYGLPDERACTPRSAADPRIAVVGEKIPPPVEPSSLRLVPTIATSSTIVKARLGPRALTCVIPSPPSTRRGDMADSVYKVIELVGSSGESFEQAARVAVERAAQSLRDLRIAEVV